MGPARYLAHFGRDDDEVLAHRRRAVEVADKHGPLRWRVLNRVDFPPMEGAEHLDDAADLVVGTELVSLVEGRQE